VKLRKTVTIVPLIAVTLMLVIPIIIYHFPFLAGGERSYMVMSGSMSPALKPGDLIIVTEMEVIDINVGDMLTVRSGELTFTHRVIEKLEGSLFRLKGDANEEPDSALVEASQIIGKVIITFSFSHLYTPYGFTSVVLAPAALIIGKQMYTIHQFTRRRNKRDTMRFRRKNRRFSTLLGTSTLLLALIFTVGTTRIMAPHLFGGSSSYFFDTEITGGFFSAGYWIIPAVIDIKPDTLNLKSQGQYVTVNATIETDYDENDIIIESVVLEGVIHAKWGEVNGTSLMVKFDRGKVIAYLIEEGYGDGGEVTLTVSGEFTDGVRFSGEDTITVINNEG
jgi:signal peptidase I